ncbi:hypothetical protein [Mycobacterium sherrisii]
MVPESGGGLAQVLGALAIEMQNQKDTEATLQAIVDGAVAIVPGARWVGISLIHDRAVESRVPSHPLVGKLDALQSELNEGPLTNGVLTDTQGPADRGVRRAVSGGQHDPRALPRGAHR